MNVNNKTLVIIAGPTAVGKTAFCVQLAKRLQTEIISADSRQFYKETVIGTAAPTKKEMDGVPHHFVGNLSIFDYYNVSIYEREAMALLGNLFQEKDFVIATGGSGLYIDTLCYGIDNLPDIDLNLRNSLIQRFQKEGLEPLVAQLQQLDEEYFAIVDQKKSQAGCASFGSLPANRTNIYFVEKKDQKQSRFQNNKNLFDIAARTTQSTYLPAD